MRFIATSSSGSEEIKIDNVKISTPSDNAPVLSSILDVNIDENQSDTVNISATDDDGDSITLSLTVNPTSFIVLVDNGDGSGTLTLSPDSDDAGTYSITVQASANGLTDTEGFDVVVSDTNQSHVLSLSESMSFSDSVTAVSAPIPVMHTVEFSESMSFSDSVIYVELSHREPSPIFQIVTISDDNSITLDWEIPEGDDENNIKGYKLRFAKDGTSHWKYIGRTYGDTAATISGLKTDMRYDIVLTALYKDDTTKSETVTEIASSTKTLKINDTTKPTKPYNVVFSSNDDTIFLDWEMPPDELDEIIGYKVRHKLAAKSQWFYPGLLFTDTVGKIKGLNEGTRYDFVITAINDFGNTPSDLMTELASSTETLKRNTTTLPTAPTNMTAVLVTESSITVDWDMPADEIEEIIGYRLHFKFTDKPHWKHIGQTALDSIARIPNLQSDRSYDILITSWNDFGTTNSQLFTQKTLP